MSSLLSNWLGNAALNTYFINRKTWLALHTTDPGVGGTLSTEVVGGGYARQRALWSTPASKTIATVNTQIFHDLPTITVRWLAVWNDSGGGDMLYRFKLPDAVSVPANGQFLASAGDIALSI